MAVSSEGEELSLGLVSPTLYDGFGDELNMSVHEYFAMDDRQEGYANKEISCKAIHMYIQNGKN